MAITLPRASSASGGAGRAGDRVRPPTEADVSKATPQSDPGVDARGAFGQEQFRALEDVGQAISGIGQVASNIQRRNEGNARDAADIAAAEALAEIENGL